DGVTTVPQAFTLSVSHTNHAPVFTSAATDTTVHVGEDLVRANIGIDPDGDNVTITVLQKPDWATLDSEPNVMMILGRPTRGQVGDYPVLVRVSDGEYSADVAYTIHVLPGPNHQPTMSLSTTSTLAESWFDATVTLSDLDGDTPSFVPNSLDHV